VTGLPDWLEGLPDAEAMRATDRWAIDERGIAGLELMERAGAGLAALIQELAIGDGPIAVICGKGNNGGDGVIAARVLREWGARVDEFHLDAGVAHAELRRAPPRDVIPFSGKRRTVCSPFNCYCYLRGRATGWPACDGQPTGGDHV